MWLEPREIAGATPEWRGMVEHVLTKERRYIKNLEEITDFMLIYVREMEGKSGLRSRTRQLLKRLGFRGS